MNIKRYIPVSTPELIVDVILFIGAVSIVAGSRLSRLTNTASIQSDHPVNIYLHEKTDLEELSHVLADSGVIADREELVWAGTLLGWRRFMRGHYQVDGEYSYDVLLSRMSRGIQDPVRVTVLPGRYEGQLLASLASHFDFDSTRLANTVSDSAFLAKENLDQQELIGRLLPDTYSMYWTSSPETVVRRMLREFQSRVVDRYRNRFRELEVGVDEIIILASIIEWEAHRNDEKAKISGLYWNRLNRGMPLQADPTINYAVGERRRLLYADYQIDHPYNTYLYTGLPPGPITNPSLSSIEAALYPAEHDYLYMVANPDGYHVFSETFEEHKEQSAKWRDWIREQYRIKKQKEREAEEANSRR